MSRAAHLDKFRRNFASARNLLSADNSERLIDMLDRIEQIDDVRRIGDLLVPVG